MFKYETIKPYLRPMSNMTEEELNECVCQSGIEDIECQNWQDIPKEKYFEARLNHSIAVFLTDSNNVDWLNAHHFDIAISLAKGLHWKHLKKCTKLKLNNMNIKELQIGNWVYNKHHDRNIQMTAYDFVTHSHYERGYQHISPSVKPVLGLDIESIPLTEEFFEKNGFVLNNSFFPLYKKYDSEDKRITISDEANSGDGYWYVHVDNEDYDTVGACNVKYVHQFQQLLRLCGYEMNVVV